VGAAAKSPQMAGGPGRSRSMPEAGPETGPNFVRRLHDCRIDRFGVQSEFREIT
jgi:hypothetical protein